MSEREVWYRYDDAWTAGEAPFLSEIPVERHTNACVVLNQYGRRRFVLKVARKRYAYPTKELALGSYIIRKQRQIQHAARTHDNARENLAAAEKIARGEAVENMSVFLFEDA